MKNLSLSFLTSGFVIQVPATGAPVLTNSYEQAQAVLQNDGYILFAFAEDWDSNSVKVSRALMNSDKVKQAAGHAVFMEVPVPNVLTGKRKEVDKIRFGKLQVPDATDYPAILMLTKDGRHYATICGPIMRSSKSSEITKLISDAMEAMHKQEKLLA